MVGSQLDFKTWLQMDELQRVSTLRGNDTLPFQLVVLASQDPSFIVRTTLLTMIEEKLQHEVKWVSLLRKMADSDPNITLRKSADLLLNNVLVAG